jgi:hypothetical protein
LNADKKYANQEELFGIFVKPDLADEFWNLLIQVFYLSQIYN